MDVFQLKTQVCFGDRALDVLGTLPGKRVFVVTDPFFARNGTAQKVAALCKGETEIFDGVQPDPTLTIVAEGLARMQNSYHPWLHLRFRALRKPE